MVIVGTPLALLINRERGVVKHKPSFFFLAFYHGTVLIRKFLVRVIEVVGVEFDAPGGVCENRSLGWEGIIDVQPVQNRCLGLISGF